MCESRRLVVCFCYGSPDFVTGSCFPSLQMPPFFPPVLILVPPAFQFRLEQDVPVAGVPAFLRAGCVAGFLEHGIEVVSYS